jgi:putative transposase
MSRRKPELQALDLTTWPTVAWTELDAPGRKHFRARIQAIERYARGEPVKDIEDATGVNRRQLYRLLERALEPHRDGRIFGFRALIAHVRVTEYVRVRPVTFPGERGNRGAVGALSQLLERYPTLAGWLRLQLKQHRIKLDQRDTDDGLHTRLRGLKAFHAEFLQQCRQVGLAATDYPFNTESRAIRSLSACVKAELLSGFGTAARAAGASHLKGLPRPDEVTGAPKAIRPYQVVEFDGHKLDVRLKIVVSDPLGFAHEFEIERMWLLAIIDVCTRTVLGYHLVIALRAREKRWTSAGPLKILESAVRGVSIRLGEKVDTTTVACPFSSTSLLYRSSGSSATARAGHYRHAARPVLCAD